MSKTDDLAAVAGALRQHDSYVITGHVDPDPDCIGSMLALAWGLERLGKDVTMVSPDALRPEWLFLPAAGDVQKPPAPAADALVVVDCELDRTGVIAEQAASFAHIYNLDHHATNDGAGTIHYIDPRAAATGEIVYDLLTHHWELELTPDAATNLYAALMTDTGSFRFANTTATTLRIAAALVEAGAKAAEIAREILDVSSWAALQLLRMSLGTLERSADGRIAWISVTRPMLAQAGATDDDAAGLVQYPRQLTGVQVALFARELPDGQSRISLRATGEVNVGTVATTFGGGGHPGAAGCTIDAPVDEALSRVVRAVQRVLPDTGSGTGGA